MTFLILSKHVNNVNENKLFITQQVHVHGNGKSVENGVAFMHVLTLHGHELHCRQDSRRRYTRTRGDEELLEWWGLTGSDAPGDCF